MATRSQHTRTSEQHRADGAKGIADVITRMVDPDGSMRREDPDEFQRGYDRMLRAHMLAMRDASSMKRQQRAGEAKEVKQQRAKQDSLRQAIKALRQACDWLEEFADGQQREQ